MRCMALVIGVIALVSGCSKQPQGHPGVQIFQTNDSLMYISASPIKIGAPVTFWYEVGPARKALLKEAIVYRLRGPGLTVAPKGQEPIVLSPLEETDAKLTRKIAVRQGSTVWYQEEEPVPPQRLDAVCSWKFTLTSDVKLKIQDIEFVAEYWSSYKSPYGEVGYLVAGDTVRIPVVKEDK
jgi:hypothetical protein